MEWQWRLQYCNSGETNNDASDVVIWTWQRNDVAGTVSDEGDTKYEAKTTLLTIPLTDTAEISWIQ